MPPEQGLGLDEEPRELRSGDQSAEAREECSIRGSQIRTGHLPSENCHLVPEHDHLDGQIALIALTQTD
jgi:hypothetical protein